MSGVRRIVFLFSLWMHQVPRQIDCSSSTPCLQQQIGRVSQFPVCHVAFAMLGSGRKPPPRPSSTNGDVDRVATFPRKLKSTTCPATYARKPFRPAYIFRHQSQPAQGTQDCQFCSAGPCSYQRGRICRTSFASNMGHSRSTLEHTSSRKQNRRWFGSCSEKKMNKKQPKSELEQGGQVG